MARPKLLHTCYLATVAICELVFVVSLRNRMIPSSLSGSDCSFMMLYASLYRMQEAVGPAATYSWQQWLPQILYISNEGKALHPKRYGSAVLLEDYKQGRTLSASLCTRDACRTQWPDTGTTPEIKANQSANTTHKR